MPVGKAAFTMICAIAWPAARPKARNPTVKICLPECFVCAIIAGTGALAQLGERLHGMQEVVGSNPIGSINISSYK
jgi:hypothetical protein